MADLRAEQIVAAFVTKLTSLATTGANVFRGRVHPVPDNKLPAILVYLGPDVPMHDDGASSSFQYLDSRLTIFVEALSKTSAAQVDTQLNQIRKEAIIALRADHTQGLAFVIDSLEGPAEPDLKGDGDKPTGSLRMEWTVLYRRSRADGSA